MNYVFTATGCKIRYSRLLALPVPGVLTVSLSRSSMATKFATFGLAFKAELLGPSWNEFVHVLS